MSDEYTPIGFVRGKVKALGLPHEFKAPEIIVRADRSSHEKDEVVEAVHLKSTALGELYDLLVPPGKWVITAWFGSVKSAGRAVTVSEGETVTVDFAFGKAKKPA
jgi:hypothetical protein